MILLCRNDGKGGAFFDRTMTRLSNPKAEPMFQRPEECGSWNMKMIFRA